CCALCTAYLPLPSFPTRRSSDLKEERGCSARENHLLGGGQHRVCLVAGKAAACLPLVCGALPHTPFLRKTGGNDMKKDIKFSTRDRKSTRLNSSHVSISYAVFCL